MTADPTANLTADLTAALAGFAAGTTADLPEPVRERIAVHTVDALTATVVGAAMPWTAAVRGYAVEESAPGPSSAVGTARRLRPELAALVTATAAHGMEIDDYALPALSHPGCVVVPVALAVAEDVGAGPAEVTAALAAGFETALRIAEAVTPSLTSDRAFHVTSAIGVLAAAATAGRLHRLPPPVMAHALGLAAAHAGGTAEFSRTGGDVKRAHAGFAAAAGIRAVRLAGHGLTAPRRALDGERGFLTAFSAGVGAAARERLADRLGVEWRTAALAVKAYCACAGLQAPIAAAEALRADGWRAADVDRLVVGLDRATLAHVGTIGPRPPDLTAAQLSAHHAVATRLVLGGNDPRHLRRTPPEVTALAERVDVELDPLAEELFPHRLVASLRLRARDGRQVALAVEAPGSPGRPLDRAAVTAKAARLAGPLIGADGTAALVAAADALDVPAVAAVLRGVPARPGQE
ncbi:MmgE/PrpD family protein [Pseudonocardia lacus]|uniref:MmgE/PrpD family protein n=1 Tax=Pseudonocardia lacus TaxID=2835865 RepID=UPI001BDD1923|nr:MmgE/PrpD family protein [Pseudonocardia lacus]